MDEKDLQAIQADIDKKRLEIEREIEEKKKKVEAEIAARRKEMEQKLSEQRAEMDRRHQEQIRLMNRQVNARDLAAKIEAEFLAGKEQVEAKVRTEVTPVLVKKGLTDDAEALMNSATTVKPLRIEDAVERGIAEAKENRPVFLDGKMPEKMPLSSGEDIPVQKHEPQGEGGIFKFVKKILRRETPEEIALDIAKREGERLAAEVKEKAEKEERERLQKEQEDRLAAEMEAKERELREEAERRAKEEAEKEAERKAKLERMAQEKATQEERERQEKERQEKEQAEKEQWAKEAKEFEIKKKQEQEKLDKEQEEQERQKREKNSQNEFYRSSDQRNDSELDKGQKVTDDVAEENREVAKKKNKGVLVRAVLFIIASMLIAATFFYGTVFVVKHIVGATNVGVVYPRAKVSSDSGELIEGVLTEQINVLVMGTDYGDSEADKDDPKRTDAMLLLSVDPKKDRVAVLSIPRDTKVILPGHRDPQKINAAYAFGGVMMAKQTVANLLGVPITHYALADWQAFTAVVDLIGGVDILVEHDMKYHDPYANLHIDIKKGFQHLNGKLAGQYVRYRSDELGDIGRTQRQQLFIRSAVKQMFSVGNIVKIPSILKTVSDYVETDMTFMTMLKVINSVKVFGEKNIKTGTLYGEFAEEDGVSYWQTDESAIKRILNELAIPSSKVK